MERKLVFVTFLAILLTYLLGMAIRVERVKASGTIYIRADGSIDPSTAHITSVDNVTYIFTGNNHDEIVVERNNIVVDGAGYLLQGTESGYGITLSGRSNVTLRNLKIKTFHFGVSLNSSSGNTVSGNNIANHEEGVYLTYSSNNTISENTIIDNGEGIALYSSSNNTVSWNRVTNNVWSVCLVSSSNNTISGNTIKNTAKGVEGIYLYSSSNYNTLLGNTITNNVFGISLRAYSNYNTVSGNNITNNDSGVWLSYSSNNTISGNTITNNDSGVFLDSLSSNTVSGNNFVNGGLSVRDSFGNVVVDNLVNGKPLFYLENASDLVVEDAGQVILVNCNRIRVENLTLSKTDVGVQLWNTNNTAITGNKITNNFHGVWLCYSSSNTVSGNNITANVINGIWFYYSSNNTISGNNILANSHSGIRLVSPSSNNTIYHNNFINNTQSISSSSNSNKWDNGCEGNYWSDYSGSDSNRDGIGDTPYVIDDDNQDNYSLMNRYWNPADVNHDLEVDIFDAVTACAAYSSTPSDLHWNCHGDITEPFGVIDMDDVNMICSSYGEEYVP